MQGPEQEPAGSVAALVDRMSACVEVSPASIITVRPQRETAARPYCAVLAGVPQQAYAQMLLTTEIDGWSFQAADAVLHGAVKLVTEVHSSLFVPT